MNNSTFNRGVLPGLAGVVALLLINAVVSYRNVRQLNEELRWVAHTQEVMAQTSKVLRTLVDAETGYRGFLVTGTDEFLEPFNAALATLPHRLARLKSLTSDNAAQQKRINKLEDLSASRMAHMKEGIGLRREKGIEAAQAFLATGDGKRRMDAVRLLVDEMNAEEESLLKDREGRARNAYGVAVTTGMVVAGLGLLIVVAFIWLLERSLSARRKAAAVIHAQQEWFRTTLASIGDAVIATDASGNATYLNAVAQDLTGWTQHDANGKPLVTVFNIINEQTRQPVENPVEKVLKLGQVVGLANHTVLIRTDGTERAIDDSAAPILADKGRVVGVVLVFRDITERRLLEKRDADRLAASRFLASIVESSEDAIITKSLEGIIQTWNAAAQRLFGYSPEQAVGRHISLIIPDDRLDEERQILSRLRAGHRIEHFETVRLRSNGQPVHISLTISPMKDEAGRVVGASKVARDIGDRKQAEERIYGLMTELKDADRRKDEFLATLAHELRGPLAPLCNMLEIMKRADGNGDLLQQARDTMERQLGQLVRLVDDLLDVSRITRNKLELRMERVELASVIHQSVEVCRPLAECANHQVNVTLPPEPIYLHADPVRLAQVFNNLLNNSCKYTEPGGKIWLTTERQGSDVVVTVKDSGIGIPTDKLASVFDMFAQVQSALERSQGGLGIGLTLVKRLVEMHGGSVSVTSEGSGQGCEFTVRLPLIVESPQAPRRPDPTWTPQAAGLRILVVDDNRDSAASLAMLLKISGNEMATAHDGLEAVAAAESFLPDVVLLDIGLPKLNGHEAARRIRGQAWGKNMVLVALTGWGQDEDRRLSKEAGFDQHMVKPVDYNALMKLLAELSDAARM